MAAQQAISLRKNQALVGQTLQVLIEAVGEAEDEAGNTEPIAVGRARRHAPEVDGLVFVPGALPVGALIDLEIAEAGPYDLWAHPAGGRRERAPSRRGGGSTASTRFSSSLSRGDPTGKTRTGGAGADGHARWNSTHWSGASADSFFEARFQNLHAGRDVGVDVGRLRHLEWLAHAKLVPRGRATGKDRHAPAPRCPGRCGSRPGGSVVSRPKKVTGSPF